jgi:probable blue pigment (indigoidine) exporter
MQESGKPSRALAIIESLVANAIWASTFVLVKLALTNMGPLTLGGFRYFGAFVLLLPFMIGDARSYRVLPGRLWIRLILLGVAAYTVGNGALYWGLQYISATTGSVALSLTPLPILFIGIFWLREIPSRLQSLGLFIVIAGSILFFTPDQTGAEPMGLGIVAIGVLGIALSGILGREIARDRLVNTLGLTALPLAAGGGILLVLGLLLEPPPTPTPTTWSVVAWLAVVNTIVAYLLYNHSLQVLTALEINVMMNLAPLATAALAWVLLGETLGVVQIVGMVVVIAGVMLVQYRRSRR